MYSFYCDLNNTNFKLGTYLINRMDLTQSSLSEHLLHSIRNCFLLKTKFIKCSIYTAFIFFILFSSNTYCHAETCSTPPCTIAGNAEYKKNWQFYWLPSNPQTIGRNSEVAVGVFGGYPPFTWTVSGTGFSMAYAETNERGNVLISVPPPVAQRQ